MGYLNNSTITVDAILTRKGRELLARGRNEFLITHFALSDDGVDYSLYNPDHPLGSNYYDSVITGMPLTEAYPDETQNMKHKLVTLPKKTIRIPVVTVPNTSITLTPGQSETIRPSTVNYTEGNATYGYTCVISDSDALTVEVSETTPAQRSGLDAAGLSVPYISDSEGSQTILVSGREFRIRAKGTILAPKRATITIIGNETGGRVVINVLVKQQTLNTTPGIPITNNPPINLP